MCGVAGIVRSDHSGLVDEQALLRMARAIRHRGPDGFGLALDAGAGLVSTRLAIVDLVRGWQPYELAPSGNILVYNGEVYNHPELRAELSAKGEAGFATTCDTEIVLRLLEREGVSSLDRLNGQFAFAWWQPKRRRLTLVRDRFGVRPLYYALLRDGSLVFGSEAKALFASGEVTAAPDLAGVDEVFTLWGPRAPRTAFAGIRQVMPGGLTVWERGKITEERRWWTPEYHPGGSSEGDLDELLRDSVRLRLRADVPVGAYLSGGLDSSLITALAQAETNHQLRTFSIAFKDPRYDERAHQEEVARAVGTQHHVVEAGPSDIARAFPDVIRHVEMPLIRTAPVPLFLLAREVRAQGITVIATGEGADELFWGYELFKEVALRELFRHEPERATALLDQLYASLGPATSRRGPGWQHFLLKTGAGDDQLGSHLTRAGATAAVKAFYRSEIAAEIGTSTSLDRLRCELPQAFEHWSRLERAAWLELATLLEPYLLSAQGDRVAMAHGVEGRFPFLDHRVFAYSARLPEDEKLRGMHEKIALRRVATKVLPPAIAKRTKQAYRAPEITPFFAVDAPGWVDELLSTSALDRTGFWDATRVAGLVRRCRTGRATGLRESMALVGILSAQLWHQEFMGRGVANYPPENHEPHVRIDRTVNAVIEEVA
jgi:asparagine synthase (glutamine-hydrolysing)